MAQQDVKKGKKRVIPSATLECRYMRREHLITDCKCFKRSVRLMMVLHTEHFMDARSVNCSVPQEPVDDILLMADHVTVTLFVASQ